MATRHPVVGYFSSEFRAICHHCGVVAAYSRKTKFVEEVLRFLAKTTLYGKIFKILFGKFLPTHRSTLLCSDFVKFCRREIGEIVRYLPDKNFGFLSNCRYCADHAQNLSYPAPNNVLRLRVLQISSESVHFRRSYSRMPVHRQISTNNDHRLRGSASPVLTATGFVNGKGQFSTPHRIDTPRIFTHDGSNDADSRKDVPFWGIFYIAPHLGGQKPQKPQFWGRE